MASSSLLPSKYFDKLDVNRLKANEIKSDNISLDNNALFERNQTSGTLTINSAGVAGSSVTDLAKYASNQSDTVRTLAVTAVEAATDATNSATDLAKYASNQADTVRTLAVTAVEAAKVNISSDNITGTNLINAASTAVTTAADAANRAYFNALEAPNASRATTYAQYAINDFSAATSQVGYLDGLLAGYKIPKTTSMSLPPS